MDDLGYGGAVGAVLHGAAEVGLHVVRQLASQQGEVPGEARIHHGDAHTLAGEAQRSPVPQEDIVESLGTFLVVRAATAGASNARYPRLRGEHGHVLDGKPDLNESPGHDLDLQPGHASR